MVPAFLYGTAWKEDATRPLTLLALEQGFRGIDTANQRRHYHEAAVGEAIAAAIASGLVTRDDLFLQTKYTFRRGQDHRLPYDENAPIATQVEQSFARSLVHLGVEVIDSYVLHGPNRSVGLTSDDWAAWKAMEKLHDAGGVSALGVSNVSAEQLQLLLEGARVKPLFVQNRCYASRGWDRQVREICTAQNITYQGFSLLTANVDVLNCRELLAIAKKHGRTASQVVFRFCLDVGMLPLTGTTSATHMREDLDLENFKLAPDEVAIIDRISG